MRQISGIISFLLVFALAGCENSKPANEGENQEVTVSKNPKSTFVIPPQASLTGDTISMNGVFVLFYGPADGDSSVSAFIDMSSKMIDSLNNNTTVFAQYTSVNNIKIYTFNSTGPMMIVRTTFAEPVGVIVSDGLQSPQVKKGFATKSDFQQFLSKYFLQPS